MLKRVNIAVVGCGTVGGATALHLIENADTIRKRYSIDVRLAAVVDKDLSRARRIGLPDALLSDDVDSVLLSPDIDIVIELVGGTGFAFTLIERALSAGKHVVTANKALLAHRGRELFAAAHAAGVSLAFEASCGGGIPVVRAIYDGLAGARFDAIYGIVNGTCNYILTQMIRRSISYDDALAEAQRDGLAEADPALDVGGHDSAHKIAIMAALAFGVGIDYDSIRVDGIDSLDLIDVQMAGRLGYVPKLLAIAERSTSGLSLRVGPALVPEKHPLAWVSGPFNAVSIYSYPTGHTMYYGRGAGGSATAGAIVADVVSIAVGGYPAVFAAPGIWPDQTPPAQIADASEIARRFYVRALVDDRPGVLSELADHFGTHGISIAGMHQDEMADNGDALAPVVLITHRVTEAVLSDAVREISALPEVAGRCTVLTIVDEPREALIDHA